MSLSFERFNGFLADFPTNKRFRGTNQQTRPSCMDAFVTFAGEAGGANTFVTMSQKECDELKEMYECLYETSFPGDAIARVAKKYSILYWTNEMYNTVSSSRC